ncbi:hypothetical protein ACHAQF_001881 [Verticillium nonalfalfae]
MPASMVGNINKGRQSVFKEVGLDDDLSDDGSQAGPTSPRADRKASLVSEREFGAITSLPTKRQRDDDVHDAGRQSDRDTGGQSHDENEDGRDEDNETKHEDQQSSRPERRRSWYTKLAAGYKRPRIKAVATAPPSSVSSLQRFTVIALLIAVVFPAFNYRSGSKKIEVGVEAGVIQTRQTSPTDVCTRWAHQAAQINGTLYIYGGQAKTRGDQEFNTWNKNFLTLDLQNSWGIDEPKLTGLEIPDGPPAVSLGYLWQDYDNLYLYGGQFADNVDDGSGEPQYATPDPMALWRYDIKNKEWSSFDDPRTSAGNYSTQSDIPVQRAAEGAGLSVPELGLSWYFGGHLDVATTRGWSIQIARLFLSSLLEWTHPGFANTGVDTLHSSGAGEGGTYRNITEGGTQGGENFPERADAVLIFVPGWGKRGVLIGLGGGANEQLTENMEKLDVYDIETSEWYKQETSGDKPPVRVNPCAVVASAPDASSFQIYLFGGQDLATDNQTQYNDMYILTIPAFHWIRVDNGDSSSVPAPRAGHTCTMRDGQMILVGGYVGEDISCDSPGIYVFNASSLQWADKFNAGDHDADISSDNLVLANSWGYRVPEPVQKVIGGNADGSATLTTPSSGPATDGPFATGKPPVFTITESGATATITQPAPGATGGSANTPSEGDNSGDDGGGNSNAGLIAAGIIAGIFALLAAYLGWCAWLYRRQVAAYKQHLAVANRYHGASNASFGLGGGAFGGLLGRGRSGRGHNRDTSTASDESFGWVGPGKEPKWMPDELTPGSNSGTTAGGSSSAAGGFARKSEDVRSGRTGDGTSRGAQTDRDSISSTEALLEGQEPSFFSVVMGPRRALRVVNGAEDTR